MASDLLILQNVNLYAGNTDPTASNHLVIQELKVPNLEENYVDHVAGGAPIGVEVDTHVMRLEATFKMAGWNQNIFKVFGKNALQENIWSAYGLLRDKRTGAAKQATAIFQGRLGRIAPDNFRRTDLHGHEYSIRGIMHYQLTIQGEEWFYWDFYTNERRVFGVDMNTDINSILHITAAA